MNCIKMKRTIAISLIVLAAVVAVSVATKQERKESATSSEEDVYLSTNRDAEISRTKRAALLPKVFKRLFHVIKKGVSKLKSLKKVNPSAPRRRPRRPRRGPTRPGRPLPEPEEPTIPQPPLPYPGIPRRTPARRPVPGPRRPVFKEPA